jgi:predicted HD superfamily hydrolase involved in NAD metabolism
MNMEYIKEKLEKKLSHKRYMHSVNVMNSSVQLAQKYGEDLEKAALAGLLHDCARDMEEKKAFELCEKYGIIIDEISQLQPVLLHGHLGAHLAREEFGVECPGILKAIDNHTLGIPGMDLLSRIIFVADYIEPGRTFPEAEAIRKAVLEDLDQAMVMGMDSTIKYILKKGELLHPDTVNTRNWLLLKLK